MAGLLNAVPAGLAVLAGRCSRWAGAIGAGTAPCVPAAAHSSVAAVAAIHARAGLDATALAARMAATGRQLTTSAVGLADQEVQSAAVLSELRPRPW
jgi:hypothetical protein